MNKLEAAESLVGIYLGTICMILLGGFCQNVLGVDFNTLSGMFVLSITVFLGVFMGMYLSLLFRKI
tara:strand:- start:1231 stop:1428 length:198 start_codon:yes stop_codon:yes gene_type:complete